MDHSVSTTSPSGKLFAAITVALLVSAVQPAAAAAPTPKAHHAVSSAARTGESYFRGIVFGDGEIARALPELWATPQDAIVRTPAVRAVVQGAKDQIIADMRLQEPGYFNELAAAINAGDRVRIGENLSHGGALLSSTLKRLKKENTAARVAKAAGTCVSVEVVAVVVLAVALDVAAVVNIDVAANVNVAANINYVWNKTHFWGEMEDMEANAGSRLQYENAVNAIALNLAVN